MQFKDSVLNDAETKYLNMYNDNARMPFSSEVSFVSRDTYSFARDNYQRRLNAEMQQYNSALETINKNYNERLIHERELKRAKKRDRKIYVPCLIVFLIAMAGLFAIIHFAMRDGIAYWAKDVIVEETSFKYFFALFSHDHNNTGFEVGITAAALAGALWLGVLIFAIVQYVREGECGWLIRLLLGGLILGGAPITLPFLTIRLLFVGLGYVVYFLLTPYGLITIGGVSAIIIIVLGRRIRLKRFKALLAFTVILTLAFTGGLWYFSNPINDKGHEYYDAHNGISLETAKELSVGGSGYALLYDESEAFYFAITPDESGQYEIFSDSGECISVQLLSSNYSLITYDTDEDISLKVFMIADTTYYLRVIPKENYHGHYQVFCTKYNSVDSFD